MSGVKPYTKATIRAIVKWSEGGFECSPDGRCSACAHRVACDVDRALATIVMLARKAGGYDD